jgi:hypothetical protein
LPSPRQLSLSKLVLTDIPPEVPNYHFLPASSLDCPSSFLSTNLTMQKTNSSPHPIFGRIPQLDGGTEKETLQCPTCQKTFEDDDDIRWHYETVIGN